MVVEDVFFLVKLFTHFRFCARSLRSCRLVFTRSLFVLSDQLFQVERVFVLDEQAHLVNAVADLRVFNQTRIPAENDVLFLNTVLHRHTCWQRNGTRTAQSLAVSGVSVFESALGFGETVISRVHSQNFIRDVFESLKVTELAKGVNELLT